MEIVFNHNQNNVNLDTSYINVVNADHVLKIVNYVQIDILALNVNQDIFQKMENAMKNLMYYVEETNIWMKIINVKNVTKIA